MSSKRYGSSSQMTDLYRFWKRWPLLLWRLLKVTAYPVMRRRMTLLSGVEPVRKRR